MNNPGEVPPNMRCGEMINGRLHMQGEEKVEFEREVLGFLVDGGLI